MGLLLDDEDYVPPRKATRVEHHTQTATARDREETEVTQQESEEGHISSRGINTIGEFSAPLEIPLRGGNGMEKMAAFAFGAERASVKLVDASPRQLRGRSGFTPSQVSLNFSDGQNNSPKTVAKCVVDVSQDICSTPEDMRNTSSSTPMTQGAYSTSFGTLGGPPRSAVLASPVSRTLFADVVKNTDTPPAVTTGAKNGEAAPKPRVQMKLSDFFTKMACTKK
ncbi:hypothetical protein TraAM80_04055 [Trypanosoma rangeli]|uniref:Uncharacterized protein n=1 Tax=Trypanosoma rangeli TaxID=5698 RepID=A0A3S5IRE5_TRYRA|nr:uncharacterized protein TraAM80_04055 [Trypanosoma rangeli]RNF06232.1 hypothetical protein TraAM80_04055 [Trypanosoma rangeli]|eukprot:RNF06232.1 hypothetical protein TraAM80_04055 [Trypanosoma rangeli]